MNKGNIVIRLGVASMALAVLAAGCSQSEDGVSDGSGSGARSSAAGSSSAAPLSPASENAATSTSLPVLDTTTSQAPAEEEPSGSSATVPTTTRGCGGIVRMGCLPRGSNGETPATTTTVASLSPVAAEVVLSDEVVGLVDFAAEACGDLLEFRCAVALEDVCFQLRSDSGFERLFRGVETDDFLITICNSYGLVHLWEVDAVLSAKYGEEYYRWNPGFVTFRGRFHSAANNFLVSESDLYPRDDYIDYVELKEIGLFYDFVDDSTWSEYLPYAVRLKLLRIFYDVGLALKSAMDSLTPRSESVSSRILSVQDFPEAYRECYRYGADSSIGMSLAEMLTSEVAGRWSGEVIECIENLCAVERASDVVVCYFGDSAIDESQDDEIVLRGRNTTVSVFFWNAIKYFCARGAADDNAFPDDTCHRVADNICRIADDADSLNLRNYRVEYTACGLRAVLYFQPYGNARARCYSEIEKVLTTIDLVSVRDSSCEDASEECAKFTEFQRGLEYRQGSEAVLYFYPWDRCSLYRLYYEFEIFWKNIPLICSQGSSLSLAFADSECYNSIRKFCGKDYGEDGFAVRHDFAMYDISPIRKADKIRGAVCSNIWDVQPQTSVNSNSSYKYLSLIPDEFQKKLFIDFPMPGASAARTIDEFIGQLTDDNIDNITSAVRECTNNSFAPSEPKCATELWQSCFNLLSHTASSKIPFFRDYYMGVIVRNSTAYVCNAAWIVELTRMATILSSNFSEDHQAGNFNQFLQYIVDEAVIEEGYYRGIPMLRIDENGKARPNLNPEDPAQDLAPEVVETLTALGNSIAKLIQPYLPDTNNADRQGNI